MLSYIESGVAGYFHACDSTLASIDCIQERFLESVGLSQEDALLNFLLAPLSMRRSIGILGFLHRVTLGRVSDQISELFRRATRSIVQEAIPARVRGVAQRHNKQLADRVTARAAEQFKRSIFGMVQCYNALPQQFVDPKSVKVLQRHLQAAVASLASEGFDRWQSIFSVGCSYASVGSFQAFFQLYLNS